MTDWIISSSVLIAAVIILRQLFKGRISQKMQYALWGLVLLRLLIPVSLFQSKISVENLTQSIVSKPNVQAIAQDWTTPRQSYESVYQELMQEFPTDSVGIPNTQPFHDGELPDQSVIIPLEPLPVKIQQEVQHRLEQSTPLYSLRQILGTVWLAGMIIVGAFLLFTNWHFSHRLKRSRIPSSVETTSVPVYVSSLTETPCLFGLLRPVIFVTPEIAARPDALQFILAHETTHYHHGDHIWAFLRCICLILHWYNPLVWLAAALSRKDCELACDESTVMRIGEDNRIAYGKTLVDMTCIRRTGKATLLTATTMLSDKKNLTERIRLIAKKPTMLISTVIIVVLIATVAAGFTFTGAPETSNLPLDITTPTESTGPTTEPSTAPTEVTLPPETAGVTGQGTAEDPYPAGIYAVGADIAPGNYVFLPDSASTPGTFRLSDTESVEEHFYGQFFWSLKEGATVEAENCHFFSAAHFTVTQNPDGSYGPGMYRVGIDIPNGSYTITPLHADKPAVWYRFFSISDPTFHNDYYRSTSTGPETLYLDSELSWGAILLEDCTLTANETFTFTVPEAPVALPVTALPQNFDVSTLVSPYYQQGVEIIGNGSYYISLPAIYPFSEDAIACQQEIYDTVLPTLEYYADRSSYTDIFETALIPYESIYTAEDIAGVGYEAYLYRNTLSIVVWERDRYGTVHYFVYSLDISTGRRLGQKSMRARAGMDTEDIRQLLEAEFTKQWPGYPFAGEAATDLNALYRQQLDNTLSDENLESSQIFFTGNGSIYVSAKIYALTDVQYNACLIPYKIAGPQTVEGYQALFDPSTEIGYLRQMALTSFYRYSSQMDLSTFFYTDFHRNELSKEEKDFLTKQGFQLALGVQCHSTAEMDAALQAVFQLSFNHSNRKGLDTLIYFPATDSYYSNHNSSIFPDITITRFKNLGNDLVKLYYTCGNQIHNEYANQELVVTVGINNDGNIRIISNQPQ